MTRYVVERILQAIIVLFVVVTVVFFMGRVLGDPVTLFTGDESMTVEELRQRREALGLDDPWLLQYGRYIGDVATGDLGNSLIIRGHSVRSLLRPAMINSVQLAGVAMALAILIAVPLGVLSALKRGTPIDLLARLVAITGLVTPSWWLGLVLIIIFASQWTLLPPSGKGGLDHFILPAFVLSYHALAGIARLTRSSMLEILDSEYVKLARVKGLPWTRVVWKHALRNALIPLVTYAGLYFAVLITSAVVIEVVFSWPGLGLHMITALGGRDYPLLQGAILLTAVFVVSFNLIVDLLYGWLDPRIRIA